jgi:stage V sporulation protein K
MENKKTSYPLTIVLSALSTILPVASGVYWAYRLFLSKQCDYYIQVDNIEIPVIASIVFLVAFIQWFVLRQPLKRMLGKAIADNEYDEFGRSKKNTYSNLTREERENLDKQRLAQIEQLLPTSVLQKITKKGSLNPEEDLNSLVGLVPVKNKVTEMVARMKFEQETRKKKYDKEKRQYGTNGRHYVFYGSAGTGKTTVARIITGFLYKYGYIKENKCIEIDGNFLKAGDMSDTKTKLLIQQAYGGVLFIDEAYAILDGSAEYGNAVIATLIKEMEDNRDKFTVILAGYKNDMKGLLDSNEGFKSRIKEYLDFPDYSTEEMKKIFVNMANSEGFAVSDEALEKFALRCEKERKLSSFGNGRTVRNVLDETLDRHALNYGNGSLVRNSSDTSPDNNSNKFMICPCDISINVNKSVL